jgi:hypothetical protein
MIRQDPLVEEMEMDVEEAIQRYKNAGGSPQNMIAWFADFLEHLLKAQPKKLRGEIQKLVHSRLCLMDDFDADNLQ